MVLVLSHLGCGGGNHHIAIVFGRIPIFFPSEFHHIPTIFSSLIHTHIYIYIYSHHIPILFVAPFWCTWHASYIAIHPTVEVQDQGQQKAHRLLSAARWWCEGPPWWKSASLDGFKRHLTGKPWKTLTCHRKIHGFRRWWKLFGDLWCCCISYLYTFDKLAGFAWFHEVCQGGSAPKFAPQARTVGGSPSAEVLASQWSICGAGVFGRHVWYHLP